jgi:phosphatidylinositol dimannoside acyltransferase
MIRLGLFSAVVRLAEWLPAPLVYRLARAVGLLLSLLPTAPGRGLRRNLGVVLGGPPSSPLLRPYVRGAYRTQSANYADLLRGRRITAAEVAAGTVAEGTGWPAFREAIAAGKGLILVTAHFGRFERMTHYVAGLGVTLTLPVERLHPPALFDLVSRLRTRRGFTLVPADLGLRPPLRGLQRGHVVALFADWDSTGHGVEVPFFGRPARLPAGPALLAVRTGAPLFVAFGVDDPRAGLVRAVVEPPLPVRRGGDLEADTRHATELLASALERGIRRFPDQWVMFHDVWPAPRTGAALPVRPDVPDHRGARAPTGVRS